MNSNKQKIIKKNAKAGFSLIKAAGVLSALSLITLSGCGSSSSESSEGYVNFYNASKNAPALYLTLDENLETSEDDEIEVTYRNVGYGETIGSSSIESRAYSYEISWQEDDSTAREDLSIIFQDSLTVADNTTQFVVVSEDISAPNINIYNIPVIDDSDDDTYDLFNLRILNVNPDSEGVDVYLSKSDETFNEAVLFGQYHYLELSENQKFDQGDYIFYITKAGNDEVLFKSTEISYSYSAQYILAVKENTGVGTSPYAIDKISSSTTEEFVDFDSEAQFNVYNAIPSHDLLENYQELLTVHLNGVDETPEIGSLAYGEFSEKVTLEHGDYSIDLLSANDQSPVLNNHLLSLPKNSNKTVFFYLEEENVDADGDGDVDENDDGIVDEIEVSVHSLVVEAATVSLLSDHEITLVNLVDSDDFSLVTFYFVRSDELIETANYKRTISFADSDSISLRNNTYQVYALAKVNSSDVILNAFELMLDDSSTEKFLIIEEDIHSATGYKVTLADQNPE